MSARQVAAIGECMIELSPRPGGQFGMGFGGDTLNTAIYLARLGISVDYVTALGDDPFSDGMLSAWAEEGVGVRQVGRVPGRLPGLYLIETSPDGERRFFYWRDRAPAREIFDGADLPSFDGYGWIYLSAISLSLYGPAGRERLYAEIDRARARGARVAFDFNYRPRGWTSPSAAAAAIDPMLRRTDLALPSIDDVEAIYGIAPLSDHVARFGGLGVSEIVIKQGGAPAHVVWSEGAGDIPVPDSVTPVDTTAAGDSFNAAYLAARITGADPAAAARSGHRLAAAVIGHPGAIIPRTAMPATVVKQGVR